MQDYARISLETHLFFARIMKEHSLFLEAGFVCKDTAWIQQADLFRREFEDLLRQAVALSNGRISGSVLNSEELTTPFTLSAENGTSRLSGIPIDTSITRAEQQLLCGQNKNRSQTFLRHVQQLNERALRLLDGPIEFKERILREVTDCRLFTVNYPLLLEHILREARLYRDTIVKIMEEHEDCFVSLLNSESFWNQIMMEHAMFIRGLLDPSEAELIETADKFAMDYAGLLEMAKRQDSRALGQTTEQSLNETLRLKEFKTAGTKGILNCQIKSIILPLLADHVLREANHYIRILESGYVWREK